MNLNLDYPKYVIPKILGLSTSHNQKAEYSYQFSRFSLSELERVAARKNRKKSRKRNKAARKARK